METKTRTIDHFDPAPLVLARKRRGLTLAALARMIHRSTVTVCQTMNGRAAGVATVAALAEVLAVDPAECWPSRPSRRSSNRRRSARAQK